MEKLSRLNALLKRIEKSRLFSRFGKMAWWGLGILAALVIGGGIAYFQVNPKETQTTETETLQTTIARKSDLVIYASGTGTLIAVDEVDLGFKTSGQVQQIRWKECEKIMKKL